MIKGRTPAEPVAEFAEMVWYHPLGEKKFPTLEYRWQEGIYLGWLEQSGEHMVGIGDHVVKARD